MIFGLIAAIYNRWSACKNTRSK